MWINPRARIEAVETPVQFFDILGSCIVLQILSISGSKTLKPSFLAPTSILYNSLVSGLHYQGLIFAKFSEVGEEQ